MRGERELTKEQLEYARESGKFDRARVQVEKESRRQRQREQRKGKQKNGGE